MSACEKWKCTYGNEEKKTAAEMTFKRLLQPTAIYGAAYFSNFNNSLSSPFSSLCTIVHFALKPVARG